MAETELEQATNAHADSGSATGAAAVADDRQLYVGNVRLIALT